MSTREISTELNLNTDSGCTLPQIGTATEEPSDLSCLCSLQPAASHTAWLQIDMDTIETSNLNRQFLFRKRHVGESKAKVAAEAVKRFRPNASIMAHQVRRRI